MNPITQQEIRETEERLGELHARAFFRLQQKLKRRQPAIDDYLNAASVRLSENANNRLLYAAAVIRKMFLDRYPHLKPVSAEHLRMREHKNVHWTVLLQEAKKQKEFFNAYLQSRLLEYAHSQSKEGLNASEASRVLVRLKTVLDVLIDSYRLSPHHKPVPNAAYEIRVSLSNIEPEIWREVRVPASCTLSRLHEALQAVMGWDDRHLHFFRMGDLEFGTCASGEELDMLPEGAFRLHDLAHGHRLVLEYVYDAGDNWSHLLEVRTVHVDPPLRVPICTDGQRAAPPENCGGPAVYRNMLAAHEDAARKDAKRHQKDHGANFNPDHFDLSEVAGRLKRLGAPMRRSQPV